MQLTSPRCVQHASTQSTHHPNFPFSINPPSAATYSASSSQPCSPPAVPAPSCSTSLSQHQSPSTSSLVTSSTTSSPPSLSWLAELLSAQFYKPCPTHTPRNKSDRNIFCVTHACVMCPYCQREAHPTSSKSTSSPSFKHNRKQANTNNCTILHISRYMYHHVVPIREMNALMDISLIQPYLNNSIKVVYLDRRSQPKSKLAPHANACLTCNRTLQDEFSFCCLYCCLKHANHPALSRHIPLPRTGPLNTPPARAATRNAARTCTAKRSAAATAAATSAATALLTDSGPPASATRSSPLTQSAVEVAPVVTAVSGEIRLKSNVATSHTVSRVRGGEQQPRRKRARKQPHPEKAAQLIVNGSGSFVLS